MSQQNRLTTNHKARAINTAGNRYGTFAEIGAGQEVARHFFQAGYASNTVAKTMSAYDKTFSDAIYGSGSRFVSQERLIKMLDHEYVLLDERLSDRSDEKAFFVFANTVATSSHEDHSHCHSWLGLRFQKSPGSQICDVILHVQMRDRLRLQQTEALGVLGVNLMHACFSEDLSAADFVSHLTDNIGTDRIELNQIIIRGKGLEHLDQRLLSLEFLQQGLTQAVLFGPDGSTLNAADELYKKPVLIQRGTFRPVTETNIQILNKGLEQMQSSCGLKKDDTVVLMEVTMSNLLADGQIQHQDFIDQVDTISALGHRVLVSNYPLFSQLKQYLRSQTDNHISIVIGARTLEKIFEEKYYDKVDGGMLGALSNLFDDKTQVLVFPFKSELSCTTAKSFNPDSKHLHLFKHFFESKQIVDILNCDDVDTSIESEDVRRMLSTGDPHWEEQVPPQVRKLIKERKLFGIK